MHHDVIIVGGGDAALAAAIFLHERGIKNIGILAKSTISKSHTSAAKGGINASLGNMEEDHHDWHAFDTIKAGAGLSDGDIVKQTCEMAPWIVNWLHDVGVKFDEENGKILQRKYGGQKTHFGKGNFAFRACFSGDSTGSEIMSALLQKVYGLDGVSFYEYSIALHFNGKNITTYSPQNGEMFTCSAKAFIFASGGLSQMYGTASSSSLLTGDCHAMLLHAGLKIKDAEFVQFHPTGLYGSGVLISEACRGEGGILLNGRGERFMEKYSQDLELAPRDIIARAIHAEYYQTGKVLLDVSHLGSEKIASRLGNAESIAKFFSGTDITKQGVPVFPTAHYNMGGMDVDATYKAALPNVYVIGEAACSSVHGANRLGCNSLLELFTSAKIVAESIELSEGKVCSDHTFQPFMFKNPWQMRSQIQQIMDEHCSVIKNREGLQKAIASILALEEQSVKQAIIPNKWDERFVSSFETQNLLLLSKLTAIASLNREESLGSHFRSDFPNAQNIPLHSLIDHNGSMSYTPVRKIS